MGRLIRAARESPRFRRFTPAGRLARVWDIRLVAKRGTSGTGREVAGCNARSFSSSPSSAADIEYAAGGIGGSGGKQPKNAFAPLGRGAGAIHGDRCRQPIQTIRCSVGRVKTGRDQPRGHGVNAYSLASTFA